MPTDDSEPPHVHEDELRQGMRETAELALANAASSVLAVAIERASRVTAEHSGGLSSRAVLMAAIRAFRLLRAGVAVVEAGYELETDPLTRTILELFVTAREVLASDEDEPAARWLRHGQRRGISGRVQAAIPRDGVYAALSQAAHGDLRALRQLAKPNGDTAIIDWGPNRTERSSSILVHYAIAARDFAVLLEDAGFGSMLELDDLDLALSSVVAGWEPDGDWTT